MIFSCVLCKWCTSVAHMSWERAFSDDSPQILDGHFALMHQAGNDRSHVFSPLSGCCSFPPRRISLHCASCLFSFFSGITSLCVTTDGTAGCEITAVSRHSAYLSSNTRQNTESIQLTMATLPISLHSLHCSCC